MVHIDNFDTIINKALVFERPGDMYVAMVLRRRKDFEGKMDSGVNEGNRLIRWYEITSPEYLASKRADIIALCEANKARAYINPQRRNMRDVLWLLHDTTSEMLRQGNTNVKLEALVRRSVASCHTSNRKRWVIDLDFDENQKNDEIERKIFVKILQNAISKVHLATDKKIQFEWLQLPTPNGRHIITEPFDLQQYAHLQKGAALPSIKDIKKDALTLLYAPASITRADRTIAKSPTFVRSYGFDENDEDLWC